MTLEVSPEPMFLEEMKNVINKLEWEIGHCLRLGKGIEWGSQYGRPGLVEGATDELLEMQAEIVVDLEIAQNLAIDVYEYLDKGAKLDCSVALQPQPISPLQSYLRRMDAFRSHVRSSLAADIEKGLVIPWEKERLLQRLKSYDAREERKIVF